MRMRAFVEYEKPYCKRVFGLDKTLKIFVRQKVWLIVRYSLLDLEELVNP